MIAQVFQVTITVDAKVESSNKPYLTEDIVKRQIEKFLSFHRITDSLPCHGKSEMKVTEVKEIPAQVTYEPTTQVQELRGHEPG